MRDITNKTVVYIYIYRKENNSKMWKNLIKISHHTILRRKPYRNHHHFPSSSIFFQTISSFTTNNNNNNNVKKDMPSSLDKDVVEEKKIPSLSSIRQIATLGKPEYKYIIGAASSLFVTSGITLAFPFVLGKVLDLALVNETAAGSTAVDPIYLSGGMLGLFFIQSAVMVGRGILLSIAGERIVARLRRRLFSALLDQEVAFFDTMRTGDIMTRLTADTQVVQRAVTRTAVNSVQSLLIVSGGVGMLFYTSPTLATLSLSVIPPVLFGARYFGKYIRKRQKEVQEKLGETGAYAEESLGGIRTIFQFAAEGRVANIYHSKIDDVYEISKDTGIVSAYYDGSLHFAANFAIVAVLLKGGSLVITGDISAGELTSFLLYSTYVGVRIAMLGSSYSDIMKAVGASDRVFEILNRLPNMSNISYANTTNDEKQPNDNTNLETVDVNRMDTVITQHPEITNGHIELRNVTFSYPSRNNVKILNNCSLTVPRNKTVAICGTSGSGKSTISGLITRLYDVNSNDDGVNNNNSEDAGGIYIDGINIKDFPLQYLRSNIGIVSQEPILFATSIFENIQFSNPDASKEDVMHAAKLANAHDFISAFPEGYGTYVGEKGIQMSGGQKQRIAIARALLKDAPILILDEATSALDNQSEKIVQSALQNLLNEKTRTTIVIAHRLSTIRSADKIAVLDFIDNNNVDSIDSGASFVEEGSHDELVNSNGVYAKLRKTLQ